MGKDIAKSEKDIAFIKLCEDTHENLKKYVLRLQNYIKENSAKHRKLINSLGLVKHKYVT